MTGTRVFFQETGLSPGDQRLCVHHPHRTDRCKGQLVYIHPFAEEMNKSRRMAALQSRAFARAGYAVLQVDLAGCGDSSGDFGDATWDAWMADVHRAAEWMAARETAPLWLWGLRAGCLVAAEAASRSGRPCNFLFWQPATAGKPLLQQFLRLRIAGEMLDGSAKGSMAQMRDRLAAGSAVEVAGYSLSAPLAAGLADAVLKPPPLGGRVECLELSTRTDAELSPAISAALDRWRASGGCSVRAAVVEGPAFWQTTEIEEAPRLIEASLRALDEAPAS